MLSDFQNPQALVEEGIAPDMDMEPEGAPPPPEPPPMAALSEFS